MEFQFTPGAERVLLHAAGWSEGSGCTELTTPALLLGLLAESECRAAVILAEHGITTQTVCQDWPTLINQPLKSGYFRPSSCAFSAIVGRALQSAYDRLSDYLYPPILETEHLLLGIVAGNDEVARWLQQRGLSTQALETNIQNRMKYRPPEDTLVGQPLEEEHDLSLFPPSLPSNPQPFIPGAEDGPARSSLVPQSFPLNPQSFLRVLDAAANRAREGLRVVEDYLRFVLDDRHLTEQCKQLRHDLVAALKCFPQEHFLAARETQADVGTALTTAAEATRLEPAQLIAANFARLQESLRSLEEFSKLSDFRLAAVPECLAAAGTAAQTFKQLRYCSYTLHRAVEITRGSRERLATAKLYVLLDGRSSAEQFQQLAEQLITAGVHILQLREKNLDDRQLLDRARLLRGLTAGTGTLFIMNDRPDLAALAHADGVHVGQAEISVKDARSIVGPTVLIGVSTHSIGQVRQAVLDGANYLGVGPTFPSGTKQFARFPGLELLKAVAAEIRLPAFAIGGITRENLDEVLQTGFTRIAVRQAVVAAPDPAAAARELLAALNVL
jgi:thiamine-phosphate pyrophosphorylase